MKSKKSKVFIAIRDTKIALSENIVSLENIELWNLNKIERNEFIKKIQRVIKPFNDNCRKNIEKEFNENRFSEIYDKVKWGILLPYQERNNIAFNSYTVLRVFLNIFSPKDINIGFYISCYEVKYEEINSKFPISGNCHDKPFNSLNFTKFHENIFQKLINLEWYSEDIKNWAYDDWKFHMAYMLVEKIISDYAKPRSLIDWQILQTNIITLYECILTRGDKHKDNGKYITAQRIEVLLSSYFKNNFDDERKNIKDLYRFRNKFIHGVYYEKMKKVAEKSMKVYKYPEISLPDFKLIESQVALSKKIFITLLYMHGKINLKEYRAESLADIIYKSIIDINIREKVNKNTDFILNLLPY
ncbi:MAG: hypothetical protein JXJ19_05265 [Elusimicrobia bacterium]|nr:hypothetical protein [Elusimicrobiota bacterium]